jgi:prepilin-type N-terminal cleavage/methylation domain-containing protein
MHTLHSSPTRGFTLVELLTVIFIIGVLASIVLVGGGTQLAKARDAEKITDVQELVLALELYYNSCREYPETIATTTENGCSNGVTLGDFMRTIPATAFEYATPSGVSTITDYVIGVTLERSDRVLQDDVDGASVHGIDCEDANLRYCVQPS